MKKKHPTRYITRQGSDTGHWRKCQHVQQWIRLGWLSDDLKRIIDETRLMFRATTKDKCNGCLAAERRGRP